MKKYFILCLALAVLWILPAAAEDRTDLLFTNSLDEEIVEIRVLYVTPDGEQRHHSSHVNLPPEAENWRLGVQGTALPMQIIFDLATKSYVFNYPALYSESEMFLEVSLEDGIPQLKCIGYEEDGSDSAVTGGEVREYLTDANRRYAVDRDLLTGLTTEGEVKTLLRETVADNAEEGTAEDELEKVVFVERGWTTQAVYFPVEWMDWIGVAKMQLMDEDDEDQGFGFDLRFRIPEEGIGEMADSLMGDLRVDGFRPWRFAMETWNEEEQERDETELVFHEGDGDKYDDQDAMQEKLFAAYADGTLAKASVIWVKEEAYDAAKAGEEPEPSQGVKVLFSRGIFEAVFVPDGRMFMDLSAENHAAAEETASADAGEISTLYLTSLLDEEVVATRLWSSTPDGESKYDSERANMRPEAEWLVYVKDGARPEEIHFDLATKSYAFEDLSGLKPADRIHLDVVYENGIPILRQTDGDDVIAEIPGEELAYLTDANRPNAVDKDSLLGAATWKEVMKDIVDSISDEETAGIAETIFPMSDGWGDRLLFPVRWKDWTGVAELRPVDKDDEESALVMKLSLDIPDDGFEGMVDSLLSDLFVNSFRPVRFSVSTYDEEDDERDMIPLAFDEDTEEERESGTESDAYDDKMTVQEALFGARADGIMVYAGGIWVTDEAFDAIRGGNKTDPGRGAQVLITKSVFEATFAPDVRMLAK